MQDSRQMLQQRATDSGENKPFTRTVVASIQNGYGLYHRYPNRAERRRKDKKFNNRKLTYGRMKMRIARPGSNGAVDNQHALLLEQTAAAVKKLKPSKDGIVAQANRAAEKAKRNS